MNIREITPFKVEWSQKQISGLRERLKAYDPPLCPKDASWQYGCDPGYLEELRQYWCEGYDFENAQKEANRFPQFLAEVEPGLKIHFVHVVGEASGRRPLLLAHGWPSSVYEFWKIVEPLAYPSRFGGRIEDAFDIILPTLPGYGASSKPNFPIASEETAAWYNRLMQLLEYDRYFVHGHDIGADVVWHMGAATPDALRGLHVNDLKPNKTLPIWPSEFHWLYNVKKANQNLGAYFQLQATRPSSLAYAMANNPVAQLAWIVERYYDWSDRRQRSFEDIFTKDELLNIVMSYYMNDSFATSTWYYYARNKRNTLSQKIKVLTGASPFPDPRTPPMPKSFVERNFNLVHWTKPTSGGHFAPLEEPAQMTQILRDWARVCDTKQ